MNRMFNVVFFTVVIFFITVTTGFCNNSFKSNILDDYQLPKLNIKEGVRHFKFDLVIYYFPYRLNTVGGVSIDDLKQGYYYKTVVSRNCLFDHLAEIRKLDEIEFEEISADASIETRVYYEFMDGDKTVCSFGLGSDGSSMLVNGKLVKSNLAAYELVLPFLPYSEVDGYMKVVKRVP